MDDDGYVAIVDRVKDMINVSGFKVWPAEVEAVFYTHPAVLEAAVYGVPDSVRGERVRAAVTLRAGHQASPDDLRGHLQRQVAAYKLPETIEMVFTQVAKGPVWPVGGGGQDVADLDLVVGDDDAVDEQLGQLPPLGEGGGGQSAPDGMAEALDPVGDCGEFQPLLGSGLQLPLLGGQGGLAAV